MSPTDFDSAILQRLDDARNRGLRNVAVDQQRLHRVAAARVVHLRVDGDLRGLSDVRVLVDVDVAAAVCVPHHRNLGVGHDVLDEFVATSGDDEVDAVVHIQDRLYVLPGFQLMHPALRDSIKPPCRFYEDP